jgi:hypothetical protein
MATVEEVLRMSGFSDREIAALDQRAMAGFNNVLTQAQTAREAAELAERNNVAFYENQIAPSLVQWEEEKSRLDNQAAKLAAEAAFYRVQNEEARKSGFISSDAPGFQPRDGQSGYVAGAPGGTPGSPQFIDVNQIYQRAGDAVGVIADVEWEHRKLFDQPLPISPTELVRRADAAHVDPRTYASREFHWDQRRTELQAKAQTEHDDKIRRDAVEKNNREWSEKVGSNPDIRQPQHSPKMVEIARGVRSGQRPDPLLMDENTRRQATRSAIRTEMAELDR